MRYLATLGSSLACCIFLSGCHSFQKNDDVERDWLGREVEIEYNVPSKVVAIWANSVFKNSGETPKRGLGGRVYFYDESHQPVRVDGKLAVYVYDDSDSKPGDKLKQEATRVIHFEKDEIEASFDPTEFGASYSFWIPWDDVGGVRKRLGIIPVFTDATGQMLVGRQARQLLPGKEPLEITDELGNPIEQVSYTEHWTEDLRKRKKRETSVSSSTIHLPQSMQKRLRNPPPKHKNWDMRESWKRRSRAGILSGHHLGSRPASEDHQTEQASDSKLDISQAVSTVPVRNDVSTVEQSTGATNAGRPKETVQTGLPPMRYQFTPIYGQDQRVEQSPGDARTLLGDLPGLRR